MRGPWETAVDWPAVQVRGSQCTLQSIHGRPLLILEVNISLSPLAEALNNCRHVTAHNEATDLERLNIWRVKSRLCRKSPIDSAGDQNLDSTFVIVLLSAIGIRKHPAGRVLQKLNLTNRSLDLILQFLVR